MRDDPMQPVRTGWCRAAPASMSHSSDCSTPTGWIAFLLLAMAAIVVLIPILNLATAIPESAVHMPELSHPTAREISVLCPAGAQRST